MGTALKSMSLRANARSLEHARDWNCCSVLRCLTTFDMTKEGRSAGYGRDARYDMGGTLDMTKEGVFNRTKGVCDMTSENIRRGYKSGKVPE